MWENLKKHTRIFFYGCIVLKPSSNLLVAISVVFLQYCTKANNRHRLFMSKH